MAEYVIATDSTADLPMEMIERFEIPVLPLMVEMGERNFMHCADYREMSAKTFYQELRSGKQARTAQVTIETFVNAFTPILEQGKDVLYISLSSGLSGTYSVSKLAGNELKEKFPDRKVISVDSLGAALGEGLLVYTAIQKQQEGMDIDTLAAWVEEHRYNLCHWFTVDDLNHLKRGGRVSAAAAIVGTALNIKPVLHVDNEGHLIPVSKVRGRKKSLQALVQEMQKTCTNIDQYEVFIGHGDCEEDAQAVAQMVRDIFPTVKPITIDYIGPVIGAHSGPGTVALFFFGTHR